MRSNISSNQGEEEALIGATQEVVVLKVHQIMEEMESLKDMDMVKDLMLVKMDKMAKVVEQIGAILDNSQTQSIMTNIEKIDSKMMG
jgi:adenylosuccinate synthase